MKPTGPTSRSEQPNNPALLVLLTGQDAAPVIEKVHGFCVQLLQFEVIRDDESGTPLDFRSTVRFAINYTGTAKRTELSYDPLGRRSRMVEKTGSMVDSEKHFAWNGLELCEERDINNAVTKRYYSQGMQVVSGSNSAGYFYTRDHLGSLREVTDTTGAIRAQYAYDAWGNRSANQITSNPVEADFGFTGHYQHIASGLTLAPYRAYDPMIGRWISRDPLDNAEMKQGPNLYAYVGNRPINRIDPKGTDYYVSTTFGHAEGTVWDNQGNQTTFDFSPVEGWRESDGGPGSLSVPMLWYDTTPEQDQQLLDAFRKQVNNQPGGYNPFTNNCWQALGKTANPILHPAPPAPSAPSGPQPIVTGVNGLR